MSEAPTDAHRSTPVQPGAWSLLRPKLSAARRASAGQLATRLVFGLVGLAIALGIYHGSAWFLQLCYQVEAIGPLLCRRLLDLLLLALLGILLLSNVITALSSFFLADDLELLAAAPLPPRSLFAARFIEQTVSSSWMVLTFGVPTLLAFAKVAGTPLSYAAVAAVVFPLAVYPAAAATAVVLLLVRLAPASRVRDLTVALMFVAFLVLYLLVRLARPEQLMNPEGFSSLVYLLSSLSAPAGGALPSHWAMQVVAATFREAPLGSGWWLWAFALYSGAGASYVMASALFRQLHQAAFSRTQSGRGVAHVSRLWAALRGRPLPADGPIRTPGRRAPGPDPLRVFFGWLPNGPTKEFVIKDAKLLLRDVTQWSQMVLLAALVFVYLYNFRHFRQIEESGLVGTLALFVIGMALCGFVTTAVSVRFAFPLISLEGRMLWLVRTAPLRARAVLRAKLISTMPPLLLMAEGMSLTSSVILGVGPWLTLLGAAVAGLIAVSVCALATGLGALLPDYRADSAARVASSFGGLVCMCLALLVSSALVASAFYPAFVLHRQVSPRPGMLAASVGVAVGVILVSLLVPLKLGARALDRAEP